MTHAIVHPRVSAIADGSDPTLIKPSDWNASHSINWGFATPNTSVITSAMADVAGDAYFDKVSLLLHCNGADLATSFVDNSSNPKTVSAIGTAKIRTNADGINPKFGSGKSFFNGSTDYLTITDSTSSIDIRSGDFTLECFFYVVSLDAGGGLFFSGNIASDSDRMQVNLTTGGGIELYKQNTVGGSSFAASSAGVVTTGSWKHFAAVQSSNEMKLFVDGVQVGSGTNTMTLAANQTIDIGRDRAGGSAKYLNGYMDDIRITKGLARYTANFTPPAIAHYDSFPGVNLQAGKNYTSTGPIEIQDTDVNIPNGAEWVIV